MNGYNFTENVRRVLAAAREEATYLHHEYVGTEHMLLALLRRGEGAALKILEQLQVDADSLPAKMEAMLKPGTSNAGPDLPYSNRAKTALELSMKEARELGHEYVGTEHLLLGLVREEKGVAAQVLGGNEARHHHALGLRRRRRGQGEIQRGDLLAVAVGDRPDHFRVDVAAVVERPVNLTALVLGADEVEHAVRARILTGHDHRSIETT